MCHAGQRACQRGADSDGRHRETQSEHTVTDQRPGIRSDSPVRSIADPYWDLLAELDEARRMGMVRRLAVGFYDGWLPTRAQVARLVDLEMGRITEDEFLQLPDPRGPDVPTPPFPANGPSSVSELPAPPAGVHLRPVSTGRTRGRAPQPDRPLAVIEVDCGELAPPFRLVATRLSSKGWTVHEGKRYRLMAMHYQLIPPAAPSNQNSRIAPVTFSAPIRCVPDADAPWSDDDGSERRHVVGRHSISGSRGRWPLAVGVRRVSFLIGRQSAPGVDPSRRPAGTLRIDLERETASWRQLSG